MELLIKLNKVYVWKDRPHVRLLTVEFKDLNTSLDNNPNIQKFITYKNLGTNQLASCLMSDFYKYSKLENE